MLRAAAQARAGPGGGDRARHRQPAAAPGGGGDPGPARPGADPWPRWTGTGPPRTPDEERRTAAVEGVPQLIEAAREHRLAELLIRPDAPDTQREVWIGEDPDQLAARRTELRNLGEQHSWAARADDALVRAAVVTDAPVLSLTPVLAETGDEVPGGWHGRAAALEGVAGGAGGEARATGLPLRPPFVPRPAPGSRGPGRRCRRTRKRSKEQGEPAVVGDGEDRPLEGLQPPPGGPRRTPGPGCRWARPGAARWLPAAPAAGSGSGPAGRRRAGRRAARPAG